MINLLQRTDASIKAGMRFIEDISIVQRNSGRPVPALKMCHPYKPTRVLDFCSGWGDRLAGVSAANVPFYIGIDSNNDLVKPYKEMITTKINSLYRPFVSLYPFIG